MVQLRGRAVSRRRHRRQPQPSPVVAIHDVQHHRGPRIPPDRCHAVLAACSRVGMLTLVRREVWSAMSVLPSGGPDAPAPGNRHHQHPSRAADPSPPWAALRGTAPAMTAASLQFGVPVVPPGRPAVPSSQQSLGPAVFSLGTAVLALLLFPADHPGPSHPRGYAGGAAAGGARQPADQPTVVRRGGRPRRLHRSRTASHPVLPADQESVQPRRQPMMPALTASVHDAG